MSKKLIIKCPNCKCEYLPAEIFIPDSLLGHPQRIVKDENGQILDFYGSDLNLQESYICDSCGKKFNVTAMLSFKAEEEKNDFEDEF